MSYQITVELSDGAFKGLAREAATLGATPSSVAASALEQYFGIGNGTRRTGLTEVEAEEARVRFERHFGELSFPGVVLSDNEQIDADLAHEYGSTHEKP